MKVFTSNCTIPPEGLTDTEQRGQLPVYTRKPLPLIPSQSRKLFWPFFPAISPERLQERTEQKARRIGPIKWALSTKNKEGVNIALKTATTETFDSEWEKTRFLYMPQQWVRNLAPIAGDLWVLDANQLLYAWDLGVISELPNLAEDDLDDRNKGDLVVKCMAILQVLCFMAQFFSRFRAHLPITQLEILTFSYAVCTPITYFPLLEQAK